MRTVFWEDFSVKMIDQRRLPARLELVVCKTPEEIVKAIQNMTVRGAPAIGVAAAFGLALAAYKSRAKNGEEIISDVVRAGKMLLKARPTAINLAWAVHGILGKLQSTTMPKAEICRMILDEAQRIADEDIATNRRIGEIGSLLIEDGDTVIHHCNTGSLAVVDWGTALGVIRTAHEQGKRVHVLVDETRPRLQGSRLTAWELEQYGISYEIICDNMAGHFLKTGKIQKVLFGADRIVANGDVANKIGTYMLALAAHANHIPVLCVAPTSTIDFSLADGSSIPIEERDQEEVLGIQFQGEQIAPLGAKARNPAFDVTPHELITCIVTETMIVRPPYTENLKKALEKSGNRKDS